jgi:hypothetical protein
MSTDADQPAPEPVFSAQQVAEHYRISLPHLLYLALWRGVGQDIGEGRLVFSRAEVARLHPRGSEHAWRTPSERMLDPDHQDPPPARRVRSQLP